MPCVPMTPTERVFVTLAASRAALPLTILQRLCLQCLWAAAMFAPVATRFKTYSVVLRKGGYG